MDAGEGIGRGLMQRLIASIGAGGVVADGLVDRMDRATCVDLLQPPLRCGPHVFGQCLVGGGVFEVADLVQRLVRGPTGNHSGSLLTSLTGGSRRFRKFSGTVGSGLVVAAELGRGLATRSILGHERFQFAVEGGGFQRGEWLV